ncbi:8-amino-7-oxononanoate synthase [Buchnera aphidicola (Neophyllaphis podocarpi)]|uniref:aminotransferase class I/II-fold pyridoxal phosphate-dependent enzyme n=1 Tax=Buchnera aphidicola TaxID=9 RepID=UPI003463C37C
MILKKYIKSSIKNIYINNKIKNRVAIDNSNPRFININNTSYLNFSSNDYLGLSHDKNIINSFIKGIKYYGLSSCSSTHITGYSRSHKLLENELSKWLGYESAVLFSSGFSANQSVITTLFNKNDQILADKLSHASIIEAAYKSKAKFNRFLHNNLYNLRKIYNKKYNKTLIVTEGIFSMDGDSAPLTDIYKLSKELGSLLLVDDAHGIGIIGDKGRGSCYKANILPDILIITFGKAFGIGGAAVLSSINIREFLLQFSKKIIYSTAMPSAQAYAILQSLKFIKKGDHLRQKLNKNIKYFKLGIKNSSFKLLKSNSAIQPIIIGKNHNTLHLSNYLKSNKLWIKAIRPPTVPPGTSRLRITINSMHKRKDLDYLLDKLFEYRYV